MNCSGIVEPDAVETAVDSQPGHKTRRGFHRLDLTGQTVFISVPADAPGAVAAHFTEAAVGIVKPHPIVAALRGGVHHHQAVSANGKMPFTKRPGQQRETALRQVLI